MPILFVVGVGTSLARFSTSSTMLPIHSAHGHHQPKSKDRSLFGLVLAMLLLAAFAFQFWYFSSQSSHAFHEYMDMRHTLAEQDSKVQLLMTQSQKTVASQNEATSDLSTVLSKTAKLEEAVTAIRRSIEKLTDEYAHSNVKQDAKLNDRLTSLDSAMASLAQTVDTKADKSTLASLAASIRAAEQAVDAQKGTAVGQAGHELSAGQLVNGAANLPLQQHDVGSVQPGGTTSQAVTSQGSGAGVIAVKQKPLSTLVDSGIIVRPLVAENLPGQDDDPVIKGAQATQATVQGEANKRMRI